MKPRHILLMLLAVMATLSSCSMTSHSMREPFTRVQFGLQDFTLSEQVSGEATSTRILGIDWARLFKQNTGTVDAPSPAVSLATIPVIGTYISGNDATANYALYELMASNTGYDVVFYPQFEKTIEKPIIGLGFLYKVTTVKVTARLGKLKK